MLSYLTCGFVTRCDVLMYVLEQIHHSSVTCTCKQIRRHSVAVHIPIISKVTVFITTVHILLHQLLAALMHCLKYTVQYCLEQKEGVLNCTCSNLFGDNLSEFKEPHLIHSLSSFLCSCHYRLFVFIFMPPPFNSFISH